MQKIKAMENSQIVADLRKFFFSEYYSILVLAIATLSYIFHFEIVGALVMLAIIMCVMIFSEDIMPSTLPFMVAIMHVLRLYNSIQGWLTIAPAAIPVVISIIFHFVYYRKKIIIDSMFWPTLGVAIAVTIGGAFTLDIKDFFTLTNLYYVLGLGFGQVLLYVLFRSNINADRKYDLKEYFVKMMLYMGLFAVIMMALQYFENLGGFIDVIKEHGFGKELEYFQASKFAAGLSNNLSAIMLWTLPFPLYYIRQNKKPFLMLAFMMIQYIFLMLILSRGGILMGTIEMAICMIYLIFVTKGNMRKIVIAIDAVCIVCALLIVIFMFDTIRGILHISSEEARVKLFAHAVECFSKYPIFGTGLAYDGNIGYNPKPGAMYWYHSTPFQIIGSLGLVGVVAYTYQFVMRIYTMRATKYKSNFNDTMLISFIGFELMACVNPGDFCPLPFMLFMTMMFCVMEIVNEQKLLNENLLDEKNNIIVILDKEKNKKAKQKH